MTKDIIIKAGKNYTIRLVPSGALRGDGVSIKLVASNGSYKECFNCKNLDDLIDNLINVKHKIHYDEVGVK